MLRIDPAVTPTMAKTPTLATWELDLLRTIDDVIRRGHLRAVAPGRLVFADGDVRIPADTLVVHCAAEGLKYPGLRPIWTPEAITPQPVRVGFPCFGAALAGYVEATRDDDAEKNRVCRPSPYSNTPSDWATMQMIGGDASLATGERGGHPRVVELHIAQSGSHPSRPRRRSGGPCGHSTTEGAHRRGTRPSRRIRRPRVRTPSRRSRVAIPLWRWAQTAGAVDAIARPRESASVSSRSNRRKSWARIQCVAHPGSHPTCQRNESLSSPT